MLDDGDAADFLVIPETLDVFEHCNNLILGELFSKCRHATFKLWQVRVFPALSALAHYAVEQSVSVVPGVAIAVQGRSGEDAIGLADMPVGLALALSAVACGASSCEDFLPGGWGWGGGWPINARGRRADGHQGQGNDQECNRTVESANCNSVIHHLFNGKRQQEMEQNKCMKDEFRGKSTLLPSKAEYQDNANGQSKSAKRCARERR